MTVAPHHRLLVPAVLALVGALAPSCVEDRHPTRDCATVIWARQEQGGELRVQGSWDGWALPGTALQSHGDGWYLVELSLPPGEHGYRILEGGALRRDAYNPLTTFRVDAEGEDEEVALALSPDCSVPELRVTAVEVSGGDVTVRGTFLAKPQGPPLDPARLVGVLGSGEPTEVTEVDPAEGTFLLRKRGLRRGKHTLTITAADTRGSAAGSARAVAWVEPASANWDEGLLYQIVTDRFRGDGGAALAPPATPGARAGGTLDGIRAEIERGTFEALGVTGLWISPVYTNPVEVRSGNDGRLYEGYHQYWPLEPRSVEPRLGGPEALDALIDTAHRHGLRVLFDLVPNHVYEASERYTTYRNSGWFNEGPEACVCGTPGCSWGDFIQTCWFTPYLADIRWQNHDAMRMAVDDALFWMDRFDADGVRIDAVPMMPRATTRRITSALRAHAAPRHALFSVGEVFTGPGLRAIDEIRYFLGPNGLDGAFDFPLMWAIRDAVASGYGGFEAVEKTLVETGAALAGSGAVLGRMIDNHDVSRFISEATFEGGNNAWTSPPPQPTRAEPYQRTRLALALVLTLPGMPVLYYGDEVALAGAGDPDNRRVMPALDALSAEQEATLMLTRRLGKLRRCSAALRRGERQLLVAGKQLYAFRRDADDGELVLALFSTAPEPVDLPLPVGAAPAGTYVDVMTGERIELSPGTPLVLPPLSHRILLPHDSPCLEAPGDLP
ncbi:alpha-amylase family glycosyl hydrolase [Chondromyces crocatus]|uniref:Alpha amylase n=1 Tax=Chondromyces crocatus TaxID=52 RepID=A0A0K1EI69_CHOCO|nr:alpha-amylase family glycosyl hydrolase [Chondromyces crocatus]AKT40283.1 alpha amylase [Chondromyces crocatus]